MVRLLTPLPYSFILVTTFGAFLIYKEKLTAIAQGDGSTFNYIMMLIIAITYASIIAKPFRYKNYIGKYIVSGKMVTRTVTVEAHEGPALGKREELRKFWALNKC
ncbi:MAG: hypothetical protein M9898_03220 [Chitinophagaceae bacterium]|nr:hypothetical protein [Chitinophagaceae bacterium]